MARTVADQMVEILAAAGVKRIYGIVGDSLNGFTDALRRAWRHRMAARAPRRGRRLRRRRRRACHRAARGLRRQLRPRQPAPHQRPLRLPSLARAGGGDRGAHSLARDRLATISRRRIPSSCSTNAPAIASSSRRPSRCRACSRSRCAGRSSSAASASSSIPGDVALKPAVDAPAPKPAGLVPAAPVDRAVGRVARPRSPQFLN